MNGLLAAAKMLDYGVPEKEVKRSWEWDRGQGQIPPTAESGVGDES
jgi:hypothetical protein